MMRYVEWPLALVLVIVLPILGLLAFRAERRSRAARLAKLGTPSMLARLAPLGTRRGLGRTLRVTAALVCCSLAFAGPRWGVTGIMSSNTGVDVALVVDASLSMMAPDVAPTRLDRAKNIIRQVRAASPNDRFALIAFAGHSYILSPPTTDQDALEMYLTDLDTATVGVRGTSIAEAINQAIPLLPGPKRDASRAIVVVSDGEDFEPYHDVLDAAKRASDAGITVVTVGVGTVAGSTIPMRARDGSMAVLRDTANQVVVTHYMPFFLRMAADAGHGLFIPPDSANPALQIRRVLDKLKPEAHTTQTGEMLSPRFTVFLLVALLLLLLDTLIVLRPRRRVLSAAAAAATVVATACGSPSGHAPAQRHPGLRSDYAHRMMYNRGT